jgi:acyl-CoA thioesterase
MKFSELIETVQRDPLNVIIPPGWTQGRSCFGGLMAALQYQAMRDQVAAERPVRSLAITFVGPAQPGVPIAFEVEILREGKAVSQVLGRALQNGQVMTLMQGSFGASRESSVAVQADPAPLFKTPEQCQQLPSVSGLTPEFLNFIDLRWGLGGLPFSHTRSPAIGGHVRLGDVHSVRLTEAHVLALVDAWPPALFPHLSRPAPGSSLTWTIEFVQPLPELTTLDWCQYRAVIEHARDGYGHTAAMLWSPRGELIAMSRQTVTVFG